MPTSRAITGDRPARARLLAAVALAALVLGAPLTVDLPRVDAAPLPAARPGTIVPPPLATQSSLPEAPLSGAYSTDVAIQVTPYRGIEPTLSLHYNSGGGDGPIGVGWDLTGLPWIQRVGEGRAPPAFTADDQYLYRGTLLIPCRSLSVSPGCRFRRTDPDHDLKYFATQVDSYQRLAYDQVSGLWYVWEKTGVRYTFTPQVATPAGTTAWNISETSDSSGHRTYYHYWRDKTGSSDLHASYPGSVEYDNGRFRTRFYWELRPDPISTGIGSEQSVSRWRLKTIAVLVGGKVSRVYRLTYSTRGAGFSQSLLRRVDQFGARARVDRQGNVTGGVSIAQMQASWDGLAQAQMSGFSQGQDPTLGQTNGQSQAKVLPFAELGQWNYEVYTTSSRQWLAGDLNGDRRQDVIAYDTPADNTPFLLYDLHLSIALSRPDGSFTKASSDWQLPYPVDTAGHSNLKVFATDVNGDGLADVVAVETGDRTAVVVLISDGHGGFSQRPTVYLPWRTRADRFDQSKLEIANPNLSNGIGTFSSSHGDSEDRWMMGDLNGDHRADLVLVSRQAGSATICVAFATPTGFNAAPSCQPTPWEWESPDPLSGPHFFLGDVNGDGRADVMMAGYRFHSVCGGPFCPQGHGYLDLGTAISRGDGTFAMHDYYAGKVYGDQSWQDDSVWFPGDTTGSGRADFMEVRRTDSDTAAVQIWTSTGIPGRASGTGDYFQPGPLSDTHKPYYFSKPFLGSPAPPVWFPGDVNGDGKTDFMGAFAAGSSGGVGTLQIGAAVSDNGGFVDVRPNTTVSTFGVGNPVGIIPGDFQGDGATDFIFAAGEYCITDPMTEIATGCIPTQTFLLPGRYILHHVRLSHTDSNPATWLTGDVSGDGRADLVHVFAADGYIHIATVITDPSGRLPTGPDGKARYVQQPPIPLSVDQNSGWRLLDVTGSGRADLVHVDFDPDCSPTVVSQPDFLGSSCAPGMKAGLKVVVIPSLGDGTWGAPITSTPPLPYEDAAHWRSGGVTGAGQTALVHLALSTRRESVGIRVDTLTSSGYTFRPSSGGGQFLPAPAGSNVEDLLNWNVADVNGDGRADLLHIELNPIASNVPTMVETSLNDGNGGFGALQSAPSGLAADPAAADWHVVDANGDGEADIVHLAFDGTSFQAETALSNGTGTWRSVHSGAVWTPPAGSGPWDDTGDWLPLDINGDHTTALAHVAMLPVRCHSNPLACDAPVQVDTLTASSDGEWTHVAATTLDTTWINGSAGLWAPAAQTGDGRAQLLQLLRSNEGFRPVMLSSTAPRQRVTDLEDSLGGTTHLDYKSSADYAAPGTMATCHLPQGVILQNVSALTVSDGRGGPSDTTTFGYYCPTWSYAERRAVGWEDTRATSSSGLDVRSTYRLLAFGLAQLASRTVLGRGAAVLSSVTNTYASPGDGPPYRSLLLSVTARDCNGTRTCVSGLQTYRYDLAGNVIWLTQKARAGAFQQDGHRPGLGATTRRTEVRYTDNRDAYIVGLPVSRRLVTVDKRGRRIRTIEAETFCYDNASTCPGAPRHGVLVSDRRADLQARKTSVSRFHYDRYGNLTIAVDPNGHATRYTYDSLYHAFPVRECSVQRRLCTGAVWNYQLGQVTRVSDMNAASWRYSYDQLGRLVGEVAPTVAARGLSGRVNIVYGNWGDPQHQYVEQSRMEGSASRLWTKEYVDGLGRTYHAEWKSTDGARPYAQDISYSDSSDRPATMSAPYDLGARTVPLERYRYDELGRLIEDQHADGTALRWSYGTVGPDETTVVAYDENGSPTEYRYDAWGRLRTATQQGDPARPQATSAFDAQDNPTTITDPGGNVTRLTWNSLNLQIAVHSPDLGRWQFKYDAAGNLRAVTDARGTVTSTVYDPLNRPVLQYVRRPSAAATFWRYDESGHGAGRGRLTSVSDPSGTGCHRSGRGSASLSLVYDKMGSITSSRRCIVGQTMLMQFRYDPLERLRKTIYPDREAVRTTYDAAGRPSAVTGATRYASEISYNAAGAPTRIVYGNGTVGSWEYSAARGWLTHERLELGKKPVYDVRYAVSDNGLIETQITDGHNTVSYTYDGLGRLVRVSGARREVFRYDSQGNITYNSALGVYRYPRSGRNGCGRRRPCARPHAVRRAGQTRYVYDSAGRMIVRGQVHIRWGADGRPAWFLSPYRRWTHVLYDAFGNLVYTADGRGSAGSGPSAATRHYDGYADYSRPTGVIKYYYVSPTLLAKRDRLGTHSYGLDRLGSTATISSKRGDVESRYGYSAYGVAKGPNGRTQPALGFTGARGDPRTGLIYMGTRAYDPAIGRFISADSTLSDPGNPQAGNPYSYANDNPLRYVDPSGHQAEEVNANLGLPVCNGAELCLQVRPPPPASPPPARPAVTVGQPDLTALQTPSASAFTPLNPVASADEYYGTASNGGSNEQPADTVASGGQASQSPDSGGAATAFLGAVMRSPQALQQELAGAPLSSAGIRTSGLEQPRLGYLNPTAAGFAGRGYIKFAELVEAGQTCAACHITHNLGHLPTDQELDLERYNTVALMSAAFTSTLQTVLAIGNKLAGAGPAASGGGGAGPAPDFVVAPQGETIIVPRGATGPTPVINPQGSVTGYAYTGGSGGGSLDPRVTTVRIMNPTTPVGSSPGYPGGYVVYQNAARQTVNPFTGQTVPRGDPFAHITLTSP